MSKLYVYSTLASDVAYTNHMAGGGDMPIELPPVVIKGGAGIANERLVTPRGIVTEVTEQEVEYLRQNELFKMHEKNGFVEVSESRVDPDTAAADMTGRDNSAPLVPEDFKPEEQPASVGGIEGDSQPAPAPKSKRK
jgi:hypothetical protein